MNDRKTVQSVVVFLGVAFLVGLVGVIALSLASKKIPESLGTLTALAGGGIASLLASTRSGPDISPPTALLMAPTPPATPLPISPTTTATTFAVGGGGGGYAPGVGGGGVDPIAGSDAVPDPPPGG